MRSWTHLLLAAGLAVAGGCTELVQVGYECPNRQRRCEPQSGGRVHTDAGGSPTDAAMDAGRTPRADAGKPGINEEGGSAADAAGAGDAAIDGTVDPGRLIRNGSFEPSGQASGLVQPIVELLDIQMIDPWSACFDLEIASVASTIEVRSAPRDPVTQVTSATVEPQEAHHADYFVQFGATPALGGFDKLSQPLSRTLRAGDEVHITFHAAAIAGNDDVFVRILGSDQQCQRDQDPEVLYEGTAMQDGAGWIRHEAVLRPTRDTNYIVFTADKQGAFNFQDDILSFPTPQMLLDHIVE